MTTLEKIRAEIEKIFCMSVVTNELRTPMEVKTEILQIIDKYAEQDSTSPCDLCKFNTKLMLIEANVSGYAQGLKDNNIMRCKDCKYFERWRSHEATEKHGQVYSCGLLVISNPSPDDYCSKAEKVEPQESEDKE